MARDALPLTRLLREPLPRLPIPCSLRGLNSHTRTESIPPPITPPPVPTHSQHRGGERAPGWRQPRRLRRGPRRHPLRGPLRPGALGLFPMAKCAAGGEAPSPPPREGDYKYMITNSQIYDHKPSLTDPSPF